MSQLDSPCVTTSLCPWKQRWLLQTTRYQLWRHAYPTHLTTLRPIFILYSTLTTPLLYIAMRYTLLSLTSLAVTSTLPATCTAMAHEARLCTLAWALRGTTFTSAHGYFSLWCLCILCHSDPYMIQCAIAITPSGYILLQWSPNGLRAYILNVRVVMCSAGLGSVHGEGGANDRRTVFAISLQASSAACHLCGRPHMSVLHGLCVWVWPC